MRKYSGIDLSIITALLSCVFAIACFTNDDWIFGTFFIVFALVYFDDFNDKRKLRREIERLNEELRKK